jgi:cytochrome c peroxidase
MGSHVDRQLETARNLAASAVLAAFCLIAVAPAGPAGAQAPARDLTALKPDYRRPPPIAVENPALVALGRELFFDPRISASGKTACVSCHTPALGWVVTDARPLNDSGKPTSRKSQPLIGLGHSGNAPVGWDGRSATLEAQAKASVATGSMSMRERRARQRFRAHAASYSGRAL